MSTNTQESKKQGFSLHKHPFVVPVVTFMVLFFVSMVGFILLGGGATIGPNDSRIVNIFVDDEKQTLPTRAKSVDQLLKKLDIKIKDGDIVEPSIDAPILQDDFNINIYRARPVMIVDGKKEVVVNSADQSPRIVARKAGIVVYPEDNVLPEAPDNLLEKGVVSERYVLDRATPVTLILYGNVSGVRSQAKTVGDVLKEKNVQTASDDIIAPSADTPLRDDMRITITRKGQQIATVEEVIKPSVKYVDDPSIIQGTEVVKEEGTPGKKVVTYEIKLENGREVARKKLQSITTIEAQAKVIARGTKIIISNPSENVKLGERMAAARGWTGQEFYCLYQIWQRESGWNTTAGNPSGAYGIPQALPGSKMASAGSDWASNPATQIAWGLGYISRYGTPCSAWARWQAQGWY